MLTFVLNITNICNQKCVFCLDSDLKKNALYLSTDESKKKIRDAKKADASVVIFMGGESVLRKDFKELVGFVKSQGMDPWVATNGVKFADKAYLLDLVSHGLAGIEFSFYSYKEEIADKMSGVSGTWRRQVRALKNIAEIRHRLSDENNIALLFNVVMNAWNYRELEGIIKFLHSLFKKNLHATLKFKGIRPAGRAAENTEILPRFSEITPFLHKAAEYARKENIDYEIEMLPLCCVPGHEHAVLETKDYVLKRGYSGWNFHAGSHKNLCENANYFKPGKCSPCAFNEICPGVWNHYLQLFGDNDINPVFKDPAAIVGKILLGKKSVDKRQEAP